MGVTIMSRHMFIKVMEEMVHITPRVWERPDPYQEVVYHVVDLPHQDPVVVFPIHRGLQYLVADLDIHHQVTVQVRQASHGKLYRNIWRFNRTCSKRPV